MPMLLPAFYEQTAIIAVAGALGVLIFFWLRSSAQPWPPGPKRRLLVGNLFDMTPRELWLKVTCWASEFGDIIHLRIFGQSIVFLNNSEITYDLLDKRGAIYSDKPNLVMVGELCGCKEMVPFLSYHEKFKRRRRLMRQTLGAPSIPRYHNSIVTETRTLIQNILDDSDNYLAHIRRYAGGLTLSAVYGYQVSSSDDKFLVLADKCMDLLANRITSGSGLWAVDILPLMKHLPNWFPGASFKRYAMEWKPLMLDFVNKPYEHSQESFKNGTILPSFCSVSFESQARLTDEENDDLKWTANSMYSASADTTLTTVSHLILAMMTHPHVLQKAQAEIDEVVGRHRLPSFSDRKSLPYMECILNEVWRWGCPIPLALPHVLREDDIYKGYLIPRGSIVIANIWAMLRDESVYPNASEFIPERFLEEVSPEMKRKMDPRSYVFGFGRRRCPGADLVESSIWLLAATMIATLDISKEKDEKGFDIEPDIKFENSFFRTPTRFKFAVTLRPGVVI